MARKAYPLANDWWLSASSTSPLCPRNTSWRSFRTRSSSCSPRLRLSSCSPAMTSTCLMRRPSFRLWWCGCGMTSSSDSGTSGCSSPSSDCLFFLHRWGRGEGDGDDLLRLCMRLRAKLSNLFYVLDAQRRCYFVSSVVSLPGSMLVMQFFINAVLIFMKELCTSFVHKYSAILWANDLIWF